MKNPPLKSHAGDHFAGTSLSSLVNRLAGPVMKDALRTSTRLRNEIPIDLFTLAQESSISPVIQELIITVVRSARNGNIHIRAERYRDLIVLEIEERNNYNGYALAYIVETLAPLARNIGAYITMKGQQQLETTISLHFLNQYEQNPYEN